MKKLTPIGALFLFVLLISACVPRDPANKTYDGYIYVQVTGINQDAWLNAGWIIDENSEMSTDILFDNPDYPPCTLYKLEYYPSTYVGYCIGRVVIPTVGANEGAGNLTWIVVNGVPINSISTPAPSG